MEKLEIAPTKSTLGITFDPDNHHLQFSGHSYPSNPITFFQPLIDWVENYLLFNEKENITLDFRITYFNTSSSAFIYRILELFNAIQLKHNNVKIIWHYMNDDDDSLESWKGIIADLDLTFELVND
jgi:hypothetical protein